jgi:ATP:ADP antiporter, AAA family
MAVRNALSRLFGLKGRELTRAGPLAAAYGLVLGSMYVLKPARNALFLGRFGAAHLPYVLLLVAVVGAVAALLYARVHRLSNAQHGVRWLFPALALVLLGFWGLFRAGHSDATVYAFFVWVNLYGVLATTLVWLIANVVFDAREARRVFGFIGAGGILGAIAGGGFTQLAVPVVGTTNLLLVGALLLLGATVLAQLPPPVAEPVRSSRREATAAPLKLLEMPLVPWLVPMVALGAIVSVTVDIQFNAIVDEAFATTDDKAAYFGLFFAMLNAVAFAFQLVGTPRILRRLGVGHALFVLPAALALGSAALLVAPALAVALVPKTADGALRHSLHKAASEILYLPLPVTLKERAKLLLDSTVDNLGTGIGALIALLVTTVLGFHHRYLALVSLAAAALWAVVIVRVQREYLEAFRHALVRRRLDPNALRVELTDAQTIASLLATLDSDNERQLTYALDMLAQVESPAVVTKTAPLLAHPAAAVRARALRVLEAQPGALVLEQAEALVHDPDSEVRRAAMHYVCTRSGSERHDRLGAYLTSHDGAVVAAALSCLGERPAAEVQEMLDDAFVRDLLEREGPHAMELRRELARLLGDLPAPALQSLRERLSQDAAPEVLEATIEATGRAGDLERVPWLIEQLGNRRVRRAARAALARFGERVLPALAAALQRPETPPAVRRAVPRVLARIPHQRAVELLLERAADAPPRARLEYFRALNQLRDASPRLGFDCARVLALIDAEIRWHVKLVELCRNADAPATPASQLLWRALLEKQAESVERVFRLLGLVYPARDIYNAYLGVTSGNRIVKASAIEFLDNLLGREVKRRIVPMLEAEPVPGVEATLDGPWLVPLLRSTDPWLRACAVYNADLLVMPDLASELDRARRDPDPVVRETAALVLARRET